MPQDQGRASKACSSCRKLKTRCYEARSPNSACLRCERLHQPCSLVVSKHIVRRANDASQIDQSSRSSVTDERIARLERTVSRLVARLGGGLEDENESESPVSVPQQRSPSPERPDPPNRGDNPSAAPVFVLRDLATEMGVESPTAVRSSYSAAALRGIDVISEGLLSVQEALTTLSIFQEHYGRWTCFDPRSSPESLLREVRKSPLLLSACCLIGVRHTNQELVDRLAPDLFDRAKSLLASALLVTPQEVDFFQAILVLSMWSTTVGQSPMSIDSWLLSGFAIQHCQASDIFNQLFQTKTISNSKADLDLLCIWNHLCLVHLHYSVGTRRRSMIGRSQIERGREILKSDHATNFEVRMVAEANLYWVLYENCCLGDPDLPKAQQALYAWRQEWKIVLEQPRAQFLEMGFSFAQLLAYDQALKFRSARVRESLLSEMTRLSVGIIDLAISTTDERQRHLSDHIYHMITFAAVTLCRLMNMYETHLSHTQNLDDLDATVSNLVVWLHSIGLPCHAAHTLGNVVSAFHKKLRPNARPSPLNLDEFNTWSDPFLSAFFPDVLGTDNSQPVNFDMLPDWEPFYQGPLS